MSLTYLNEYAQRKGLNVSTTFTSSGNSHTPEWTAILNIKSADESFNHTTTATSTSKGASKNEAADLMMEYIREIDYSIAIVEKETGNHYYIVESATCKVLNEIKRMGLKPEEVDLLLHSPTERSLFESPAVSNGVKDHSLRVVNFTQPRAKGQPQSKVLQTETKEHRVLGDDGFVRPFADIDLEKAHRIIEEWYVKNHGAKAEKIHRISEKELDEQIKQMHQRDFQNMTLSEIKGKYGTNSKLYLKKWQQENNDPGTDLLQWYEVEDGVYARDVGCDSLLKLKIPFLTPEKAKERFGKYAIDIRQPRTVGIPQTGDQPMEPAMIGQAAQAQQTGAARNMGNPQPTEVIPAMTTNSDPTNASLELAPTMSLVPFGTPNMLAMGAITFDIKDLIYAQHMDSDVEYGIPADAPSGTIISVIPYDPQSQFVNEYIKQYVGMHGRYTGAIEFRITVIGNPLYSGSIIVGWQPRVPKTTTIKMSELQKFSYHAEGTVLPWNKIHRLHDARRTHFYRQTKQMGPDEEERPCLVIALFMSIQNPLKEDALVRMRISSKLVADGEGNPFVCSEPFISEETKPQTTQPQQVLQRQFDSLFPGTLNQRLYMATDGYRYSINNKRTPGIFYPPFTPVNNVTAFMGTNSTTILGPALKVWSTGSSSFAGIKDQFSTRFPTYAAKLGITTHPANTHYNIGTMVVSNIPENKLGKYLNGMPIEGFLSDYRPGTAVSFDLSEAGWLAAKKITSWRNDTPLEKEARDSVQTIIEQAIVTRAYSAESEGRFLAYGHLDGTKVITRDGTFVIVLGYYYYYDTAQSTNRLINIIRKPTQEERDNFILPKIPLTLVDTGVTTPGTTRILPSGYRAFRITEMIPTSITYAPFNFRQMTLTDNVEVLRYFENIQVPPTQVLQFQLQNNTSNRVFATVRFIEGMFVINTRGMEEFYRTCPWVSSQISVINQIIIESTQEFPITDTSDWLLRSSTSYSSDFAAMNADLPDLTKLQFGALRIEGQPQAALAAAIGGGALQGVGQAISKVQDQKWQEKMQGNMFDFNKEMQQSLFGQQETLQGNQFNNDALMQKGNFDFQEMMQTNAFKQQNRMFNMDTDRRMQMKSMDFQNNLASRGISTQTSTGMGGGSFSLQHPSSFGGSSEV